MRGPERITVDACFEILGVIAADCSLTPTSMHLWWMKYFEDLCLDSAISFTSNNVVLQAAATSHYSFCTPSVESPCAGNLCVMQQPSDGSPRCLILLVDVGAS